jgi:hypothetical protein
MEAAIAIEPTSMRSQAFMPCSIALGYSDLFSNIKIEPFNFGYKKTK